MRTVGDAIIWLRKPGLNILKWSANKNKTIRFKDGYAFKTNEFFFSGYCGTDKVRQLLSDNHSLFCYQDLDFCFVIFLLLGLVPTTQSRYYRCYFNQKLMAALPGYVPFATLL